MFPYRYVELQADGIPYADYRMTYRENGEKLKKRAEEASGLSCKVLFERELSAHAQDVLVLLNEARNHPEIYATMGTLRNLASVLLAEGVNMMETRFLKSTTLERQKIRQTRMPRKSPNVEPHAILADMMGGETDGEHVSQLNDSNKVQLNIICLQELMQDLLYEGGLLEIEYQINRAKNARNAKSA
jgi:hypothetical protein